MLREGAKHEMRILITNDHPIILKGIKRLIEDGIEDAEIDEALSYKKKSMGLIRFMDLNLLDFYLLCVVCVILSGSIIKRLIF